MAGNWKTVLSFSLPIEAHVARTKLESEGIECHIADEHIVRMDWFYSNAVGGVKLQVREEDFEVALEALSHRPPLEVVQAEDHNACPKCRSISVDYDTPVRRFAFLALFLGLPFPYLRRKLKCHSCGHVWKQ